MKETWWRHHSSLPLVPLADFCVVEVSLCSDLWTALKLPVNNVNQKKKYYLDKEMGFFFFFLFLVLFLPYEMTDSVANTFDAEFRFHSGKRSIEFDPRSTIDPWMTSPLSDYYLSWRHHSRAARKKDLHPLRPGVTLVLARLPRHRASTNANPLRYRWVTMTSSESSSLPIWSCVGSVTRKYARSKPISVTDVAIRFGMRYGNVSQTL